MQPEGSSLCVERSRLGFQPDTVRGCLLGLISSRHVGQAVSLSSLIGTKLNEPNHDRLTACRTYHARVVRKNLERKTHARTT